MLTEQRQRRNIEGLALLALIHLVTHCRFLVLSDATPHATLHTAHVFHSGIAHDVAFPVASSTARSPRMP